MENYSIEEDVMSAIEEGATEQGQLVFLNENRSATRTDNLITHAIENITNGKVVTLIGVTISKKILEYRIGIRMERSKPEKAKKIKENLRNLRLEVANPLDALIRKVEPTLPQTATEHLVILDLANASYDDRLLSEIDRMLRLYPHLTILVALKTMQGHTVSNPIFRGRNVTRIKMENL